MRLTHFCIGSIKTQDLLISKTFHASQGDSSTNIQDIWATFLDLFQKEQHWTPLRQQLHPDRSTVSPGGSTSSISSLSRPLTGDRQSPTLSTPSSAAGMASARQDSPRQPKGAPQHNLGQLLPATVSTPLFSKDTSFIYRIANDLVLVACCPPPPTPATLTSSITRIPQSIPGQQTSRTLTPSSSSSLQGATLLQEKEDKQPNKLAYTNSASLQVSLHHTVEFLLFLTKAMERYLLGENSSGTNRASVSPTPRRSSGQFASGGLGKSGASPILSADLVQLNSGIVYEILDECLEQGFPMMPSLAQLDLLVFGVPVK